MTRIVGVCAVLLATLSWGPSSMRAQMPVAPPQPPAQQLPLQNNRPGYPTLAQVQVLNKLPADAVAVKVLNTEPLATSVVGVPTVALTTGSSIETRASRQRWEYRRLLVANGSDPVDALNAAGADGWDAVGMLPVDATRSAILLKRATIR
jgi:hypothetical protein